MLRLPCQKGGRKTIHLVIGANVFLHSVKGYLSKAPPLSHLSDCISPWQVVVVGAGASSLPVLPSWQSSAAVCMGGSQAAARGSIMAAIRVEPAGAIAANHRPPSSAQPSRRPGLSGAQGRTGVFSRFPPLPPPPPDSPTHSGEMPDSSQANSFWGKLGWRTDAGLYMYVVKMIGMGALLMIPTSFHFSIKDIHQTPLTIPVAARPTIAHHHPGEIPHQTWPPTGQSPLGKPAGCFPFE